jgi:hypothetical protein
MRAGMSRRMRRRMRCYMRGGAGQRRMRCCAGGSSVAMGRVKLVIQRVAKRVMLTGLPVQRIRPKKGLGISLRERCFQPCQTQAGQVAAVLSLLV